MSRLLVLLGPLLWALLPLSAAAGPLQLAAGGGVGSRRFFWVDPLHGDLRGYRAQAYPVVIASADLVAVSDPGFGDLGVLGSLSAAAGLSSETARGETLTTRHTRYDLGPRLRLRPWGDGATVFTVLGTFGRTGFELDGRIGGEVPSFAYRYVRVGGEVRVPLGAVALLGSGSYLGVLASGALGERFRDHAVQGVDGSVGAGIRLSRALELRALFQYAHFAHDMDPVPGDAHVAGGALDQYLGATAQIAFTP